MMTRNLNLLSLLIIFLLFVGCPYLSNIPLDSNQNAKIDKKLIGTWRNPVEQSASLTILNIYQFNEREYLILIEEESEIALYGAHVTLLDGHKFLNVHRLESEPQEKLEYAFVNYQVHNDTLFLQIIEDQIITEQFNNSKKLRKFIIENLKNANLFGEKETLIRKRE